MKNSGGRLGARPGLAARSRHPAVPRCAPSEIEGDAHRDLPNVLPGAQGGCLLVRRVVVLRRGAVLEDGGEPENVEARVQVVRGAYRVLDTIETARIACRAAFQLALPLQRFDDVSLRAQRAAPATFHGDQERVVLVAVEAPGEDPGSRLPQLLHTEVRLDRVGSPLLLSRTFSPSLLVIAPLPQRTSDFHSR